MKKYDVRSTGKASPGRFVFSYAFSILVCFHHFYELVSVQPDRVLRIQKWGSKNVLIEQILEWVKTTFHQKKIKTDWLKLIKMAIPFHQMVQTTETTQTVTQTRRVFTPEHEAQTRDQSFEIPNWAVRVSLGVNVGLAGIIVIMMYFYFFWNSSI